MTTALYANAEGRLTEDDRRQLALEAVATFNAVEAAWDTYRRHLDGHGLLEFARQTTG